MEYLCEDITRKIIGCAYKVHNTLGSGFLEKVYENALKIELERNGLVVEQQKQIQVQYEGVVVGHYVPDLLVDSSVVIEIKAVDNIDPVFEAQLLNYLKATGLRIGLLINFGPKVTIKRRVL